MSIAPLLTSVTQFSPSTIQPEIARPLPNKLGQGLPVTTFENTLAEQIQRQTDPILHPNEMKAIAPANLSSFVGQAVQGVQAAQTNAAQSAQKVLQGDGAALHQSMIAMEEASVSFQLLVEMRNKMVESLQELMRIQV